MSGPARTPIQLAAARAQRANDRADAWASRGMLGDDSGAWSQYERDRHDAEERFRAIGIPQGLAWRLIQARYFYPDEIAITPDYDLIGLRGIGPVRMHTIRAAIPYIGEERVDAAAPKPTETTYPAVMLEFARVLASMADHSVHDNGDGTWTHTYSWSYTEPGAGEEGERDH
jgi:hypothetical protein